MHMTKRDVADIALVWVLSTMIVSLLFSIAMFASQMHTLGMGRGVGAPSLIPFFFFEVLQIIVLLLLTYVLIFKRVAVLTFLFPDAHEKEIVVPSGMEILTSYAFWIRLFGIFEFLSKGTGLLGRFAWIATARSSFLETGSAPYSYFVEQTWPSAISVAVAAAIVWKAEWIADMLKKVCPREEPADDAGTMDV
jgi:hypothetical protein